MIPPAGELDELLRVAGPEDGTVACVPALQGLGTPSWDAEIRAGLIGMTRATTRAQLARAVVDGVLHQVVDALAAIEIRMPLSTVLLDGGMARSDWVLQRLADLADVEVRRAARSEATAIGAAMAAGLAVGFWGESRSSERPTPTSSRIRGWPRPTGPRCVTGGRPQSTSCHAGTEAGVQNNGLSAAYNAR